MTKEYLYWSSNFEREEIAAESERLLGFPNLVGFIDGSQFDLAFAPTWKRDEFWNRKGGYSMNTIAICDNNKRIRYISSGYFGSSHDMRVLNESHLGKEPEYFFSGEQYVLGDGGFKALNYLVPIRKKPRGQPMSKADEKFNTYISMMRIKIEHAFGILKNRFYSLKSIPIKIKGEYDATRVTYWIRVCIILNNFLMSQEDDNLTVGLKAIWDEKEKKTLKKLQDEGLLYNEAEFVTGREIIDEEGAAKYKRIQRIVLEKNGKLHLLEEGN